MGAMRTFEHAGLVRLVANRAARSGIIPLEEAVQDGALGLMEALDRWDESRGLAFSTFAYPRIAGAIKDAARQRDRLPRSWRRRQTEMSRAKERLRAALHCEPTAHDVASELGLSVEEVWDWSARVGEPYSLDDSVSDDGQLLQDTIAGSDGREESDQIEHMLVVKARIRRLTPRELQVLALYFYDGLKLHEIADVFGLTTGRISQIRTKALGKLRLDQPAKVA